MVTSFLYYYIFSLVLGVTIIRDPLTSFANVYKSAICLDDSSFYCKRRSSLNIRILLQIELFPPSDDYRSGDSLECSVNSVEKPDEYVKF